MRIIALVFAFLLVSAVIVEYAEAFDFESMIQNMKKFFKNMPDKMKGLIAKLKKDPDGFHQKHKKLWKTIEKSK